MPHQRQQLGLEGENFAAQYLEGKGYTILTRNWHAGRYGEIDIVAEDAGTLVVVEVKTRHGVGFGNPEDAVNKTKQEKLRAAAQAYLTAHPQLPQQARIEVVAVVLSHEGGVLDLKHYQDI
jgi:putative endonuclease